MLRGLRVTAPTALAALYASVPRSIQYDAAFNDTTITTTTTTVTNPSTKVLEKKVAEKKAPEKKGRKPAPKFDVANELLATRRSDTTGIGSGLG